MRHMPSSKPAASNTALRSATRSRSRSCSAKVGTPLLAGATVQAQVEQQYRGPKIVVFKYKPKKRYRRRTGHRQSLTRVAITAINA
jgi:ribosomal protein L21